MSETATAYNGEADSRPGGRMALLQEFWAYFSENRGAVIGLCFFVAVALVALFADHIAPHHPNHQYREAFLQPPFWQEGGSLEFPLGTDAVGRDILSRLIHGARYSLFIGCVVVSGALAAGVVLVSLLVATATSNSTSATRTALASSSG